MNDEVCKTIHYLKGYNERVTKYSYQKKTNEQSDTEDKKKSSYIWGKTKKQKTRANNTGLFLLLSFFFLCNLKNQIQTNF